MDSVGLMMPWLTTLNALHKSEFLLGSFPTITLAGTKFLSLQVDQALSSEPKTSLVGS